MSLFFAQKEDCYYAAKAYQKLNQQRIYEVVQMEGDVITIPSGWWHQTFHKGLTVGLASQYANSNNIDNVVQSLIDWHELKSTCLGEAFNISSQMVKTRRVVECIVAQREAVGNFWHRNRISEHCVQPFSFRDANGEYRCKHKEEHQHVDL